MATSGFFGFCRKNTWHFDVPVLFLSLRYGVDFCSSQFVFFHFIFSYYKQQDASTMLPYQKPVDSITVDLPITSPTVSFAWRGILSATFILPFMSTTVLRWKLRKLRKPMRRKKVIVSMSHPSWIRCHRKTWTLMILLIEPLFEVL